MKKKKKLNSFYAHIYNGYVKRNSSKSGSMSQSDVYFNRMLKDFLIDLQFYSVSPSAEYLSKQVSMMVEQANLLSENNKPDFSSADESINWSVLANSIQCSNIDWDEKFDVDNPRYLVCKAVAMIPSENLSSKEIGVISSALGGVHIKDFGVIHVVCAKVLRSSSINEKIKPYFDNSLKFLMLSYLRDDMIAYEGFCDLEVMKRPLFNKFKDKVLLGFFM